MLRAHERGATIGAMNDLPTLSRLLENMVRFGTIAAVQHVPPRVTVSTGNLVTTWLPWVAGRAGEDVEWDPPTPGEQVLIISPSGQLANGVVFTGLFCDAIPANGDRAGLHRRTYRDGAVIEYDSVAHHLNVTLPAGGTTNLVSTGGITIEGPITHKGDYIQTGNQTVTGKVTVSQDVIAGGISVVQHKHTGVTRGGSTTDGPQP